jgi:hypothetical protein
MRKAKGPHKKVPVPMATLVSEIPTTGSPSCHQDSSHPSCSMCGKREVEMLPSPFSEAERLCDGCMALIGLSGSKRKATRQFASDSLPERHKKPRIKGKKTNSRTSLKDTKVIKKDRKRKKTKEFQEDLHILSRKIVTYHSDFVLHPNLSVHVKDAAGDYWPGTILKVEKGKVLIHYYGWADGFDEWLDSESKRIQVFHVDVSSNVRNQDQQPHMSPRRLEKDIEKVPVTPESTVRLSVQTITPPASPKELEENTNPYHIGQTVFVSHDKFFAPGTIVNTKPKECLVSYLGWTNITQEWVDVDDVTLLETNHVGSSSTKVFPIDVEVKEEG